jgi:hypothetical protein
MSEDVDAEDRCPHCRLAFEIIWVKFELIRTKTLAICPNCLQVQSVPATNNLAAVGAKLDRAPTSRLPRRWQVSPALKLAAERYLSVCRPRPARSL